ncbi:MAG: redoxin family protein [Terrimonas sp.]|nr:redoxin family protein [Terrimonas sp.]
MKCFNKNGSRFSGFLAMICLTGTLMAQTSPTKPLKRGDLFPYLTLSDRNGQPVELKTAAGRLLLIDFWNVHCVACIKAMPKLDSLQRIMGDSLKVISVTHDPEKNVANLFDRLKLKTPSYPMIVSDSILSRLFPHEVDPYYIWIKDGQVSYISNGWSLSHENIKRLIAGYRLNFVQRLSLPNYDRNSALLAPSTPLEEYSLLLRGLEDYHVGGSIETWDDLIYQEPYFLKAINQSRLRLLIKAYWHEVFGFETRQYLEPNRFIRLDSSAADLLLASSHQNQDEWIKANVFSYEIKVNPANGNNLYLKMRKDLAQLFPYEVIRDTAKLPCLVLEVSDSVLFSRVKRVMPEKQPGLDWKTKAIEIRNLSLNNSIVKLVTESQLFGKGMLCINQTGYTGPVDMRLSICFDDLACLQKELAKYGLSLLEKDYFVQTLLIKKR